MKIHINMSGTLDYRLPDQGLYNLKSACFENIVIDVSEPSVDGFKSCKEQFSALAEGDTIEKSTDTIIARATEKGLRSEIFRTLDFRGIMTSSVDAETLRKISIKTIKACSKHKGKAVIVPTLINDESQIIDYYLLLYNSAAEYGLSVLIENGYRYFNGHFIRNVFSDAYRLSEIVDELNSRTNSKIFGLCLNAGICNLCGIDMNEFALTAGKRIKSVILRDNNSIHYSSLLPFSSVGIGVKTDWSGLICGLRHICFDGDLIIDIADTARVYSQLLRPQLFSLTKSITDYFALQIGIENKLKKYDQRVLFGAGNMCRNYMHCYGEKYPPLYTCDNNSSRWGEIFCGLEIKKPEELKQLPPDCAVFICNTFYNEISAQLKKLEITNPIEYFNDEYLPSFPCDRLEV